ncbi:ring-exported protein 2 [Plasmodium reichenowi]|uniref:Ring-exported protein 2 n=1 Tax=Plasmodium reichenowi TaxID=5854 RepID=A0A151LI61_PLARE|nr:ring-exported protein 2 [Plasmodium reichenowi]KYN98658.1 ring-exported protein 2 [Plasmodium reichenowi]
MKMNLADIFSSGKESFLSLKHTLGSSKFSPLKPCEGLECLPQVLFLYVIFLLVCTGIFVHNKNKLKKKQRLTNMNDSYDAKNSGCAEQYDQQEHQEYHHEKSHNNGQNSKVHKDSFQNNSSQNPVHKSKVENQKVPVAQGSQHKSATVNA